MKRTLAAMIVAATLLGVNAVAAGATVTPKVAVTYGDSLTWESLNPLAAQYTHKKGWSDHTHTFPGYALCDFNAWLPNDLAAFHPAVVAVETAGNYNRPCMNGLAPSTTAFFDQYRADIDTFFGTATATGAKVVWVVAPPMPDSEWNSRILTLRTIATAEARKYHGVSISNSPRNAVSNSGKWTLTKKCLTIETTAGECSTDGTIVVRTVTGNVYGVHFCPDGPTLTFPYCDVYSSGEYRWGHAEANTTVAPPKPLLP